ncbi:class I SAM-dependent methyltransferase [uncultured Spirosoma sp.]|uniref:class I SAM-dependent methyltransferase n=1 Tax=uncultured Spirosoma sp. TaxID=278208 RepID=UPI0025896917|nr:class I SAM-dependent methyltransferase [uncultured Spirosoma sp.]
MRFYQNKKEIYFTQVREDLIEQMPNNPNATVLEIGCGGGDTLVAIKERKLAKEVFGVELFNIENSNQRNPAIDRMFIGNIENISPDYPENYFDIILCGDVLEHLVDPWKVIERITPFLKEGGLIIVSCPNIREIFNLGKILISGRFKYQDSGIMDKTHLRFFGKKDLADMLTTKQLRPVKVSPNYFITPRRKKFKFIHAGLLDDFFAAQNIVVAKKI